MRLFGELCENYPLDTHIVEIYDRFSAHRDRPRVVITLGDIKGEFDKEEGELYKTYIIPSNFKNLKNQIEKGQIQADTRIFSDTKEAFYEAFKAEHGVDYDTYLKRKINAFYREAGENGKIN